MRPTLALVIALSGLACARLHTSEAPSDARVGVYAYRLEIGGTPHLGQFTVEADTASMDPEVGYCQPLVRTADRQLYTWECTDSGDLDRLTVRLDARNPLHKATWSGTRSVEQYRQVCAAYTTDSMGHQVCSRYEQQPYFVKRSAGGMLIVSSPTP